MDEYRPIPMPDSLRYATGDDDGDGELPVESTGEIRNSFDLARLRALALRSTRVREVFMPASESEVLESDRPLKFEVYKLLLSGQSCEAISDHIARIKGILVLPQDIAAFRDIIPEDNFLPPTYLAERQRGLDAAVDPISEVHKILRLMEERLGAATLLEEADGYPNSATTTLAESYFNMLLQTVKLRQSLGDVPEKTAMDLPAIPQKQSDAPSVQAILLNLTVQSSRDQNQSPQPPVQRGVSVKGDVIDAEVKVIE